MIYLNKHLTIVCMHYFYKERERHRWKSDLLICLDIRSISDIYIGKSWQNCKHLRVGFHWHKTKIWHFVNVESHNVDSQNFVIICENSTLYENSTFCEFDILCVRHYVNSTFCEFDIMWIRHFVIRHFVNSTFCSSTYCDSTLCDSTFCSHSF